MCVNTKPEPKCMCADGFTLDYDDETCTGNFSLLFVEIVTCFIYSKMQYLYHLTISLHV